MPVQYDLRCKGGVAASRSSASVRHSLATAMHNVWDSTHTILYGSYTETTVFLDPDSADLGGPDYSWLTFFDPNFDVLFVDNFQVECVPEPSTLAMLALGAVGLVAARRRRHA